MFETVSPIRRQQQPTNRRGKCRYPLTVPVYYRAQNGQRAPWKKGTTVDMSATGILLDLPSEVEPGEELALALEWTGLYHAKERMRLLARVEVLRRDERGTAVRILEHEFEEVQAVVPTRYVRGKEKLAVA